MDRVCYFSNTDLSIGPNLNLAEVRVSEYEKCAPSEINGIIELWHIRKLFENVVPKTECLEDFEMIKSNNSSLIIRVSSSMFQY